MQHRNKTQCRHPTWDPATGAPQRAGAEQELSRKSGKPAGCGEYLTTRKAARKVHSQHTPTTFSSRDLQLIETDVRAACPGFPTRHPRREALGPRSAPTGLPAPARSGCPTRRRDKEPPGLGPSAGRPASFPWLFKVNDAGKEPLGNTESRAERPRKRRPARPTAPRAALNSEGRGTARAPRAADRGRAPRGAAPQVRPLRGRRRAAAPQVRAGPAHGGTAQRGRARRRAPQGGRSPGRRPSPPPTAHLSRGSIQLVVRLPWSM